MSIASEISRLQQAKADIKTAIEAKGVTVLSSLKLDGYASCISQISGGEARLTIPDGLKFAYSTFSALPQMLQEGNWDNVIDMERCFYFCTRLSSISFSGLSNVSNMSSCFHACSSLSSISLPGLSNVTNMPSCFNGCTRLSSISLSGLSNVTNMGSCFSDCSSLSSISLSGLSSVSNMGNCFNGCRRLSSISLSGLSNVTNMSGCFDNCVSLVSISLSELSNVSNMSSCFRSCISLVSISLLGLSKVTNLSSCFFGCDKLENLIVDSWGTVITNLTNWGITWCTRLNHQSLLNLISALYTTSVSRTCTIGTTNLAKLSADEIAVATAKGWNLN